MSVLTAIAPQKKAKVLKFPQSKLLTFKDYERLTPPDNGNYELHNGQIIFMASPIPAHQKVSMRLSSRLFNHIDRHKLGEILTAPMDVVLRQMILFSLIFFF